MIRILIIELANYVTVPIIYIITRKRNTKVRELKGLRTIKTIAVKSGYEARIIRFFSTEEHNSDHFYTWIAIPILVTVKRNFLFYSNTGSEERLFLESHLRKRCHPLKIGQRCADWFLLKMLVSGTMAGKLVEKIQDEDIPYTHLFLC